MPENIEASVSEARIGDVSPGQTSPSMDQSYVDAMAAKADAGLNAGPKGEKLYAGKYKSEADLQKGILELAAKQSGGLEAFYKSLETNMGKPATSPETDAESDPDTENKNDPDTEKKAENADPSTMAGAVDLASQEWAEKGELTESTYAALEKAGLGKDMVDNFIAGQEAMAEKATAEIMQIVGGPQAYEHMKGWAMENCTPEEIQQFNAAIVSNNMPRVKMAMRAMNALYIEREGKAPHLLKPSSAQYSNSDGYQSRAQMTADMRDPRYSKDPAFRQQVVERTRNSKF